MDPDIQLPLSPAEWHLMSAVWELEPADALQVSEFMRKRFNRTYSPKSAGILLSRLAQKGYLDFTTPDPVQRGRPAYVYTSKIARDEALGHLLRKFIANFGLEFRDFDTLQSLLKQVLL